VVVNNSSVFYASSDYSKGWLDAEWDAFQNINLKAPMMISHAARLELALHPGGCIVNITDLYGDSPRKNFSAYCISKAGLIMGTKALAKDFAPQIRVNCVSPGAIEWLDHSEEEVKEYLSYVPLDRKGECRNIAETVLFVIRNDYITGQNIRVDGGKSI